jgi:DNA-binding MurR/RpiR family transcriptional regulator
MNTPSHGRLIERLQKEMDGFTEAERAIAGFLLADRQSVPFETASSLADKLGVSPVTVGRFCRRLGFRNFRALKDELKYDIAATPWPVGDQFGALTAAMPELQRDLDMTLAGVMEVYRLAATPGWATIVDLLASCEELLIAGFQTERGIAEHFAHLLQYARPGVRLVDLAAGNFADVLADERPGRCLVIVETRRYSRQAQMLAQQARDADIELVFVTDKYCHWAKGLTPHVLALPDESALFWSTMVPMLAALTLLAQGVVLKLGAAAQPRLARVSQLYQDFTGHVGQPQGKRPR